MDNNKPPPPLAQGGPQGATLTNPPAQGHVSPTGNASTSINRPRRLPNTYTEDERNRIHRFLTFGAPRQVACYDYVLEGNYWDFPSLEPKMADFEEFEEMHAWWAQNREKYYRATELNIIFRAKQLSLTTAPQPAQSSSASAARPASDTVPAGRPKDLEFPDVTKTRMAGKNGKETVGARQGTPVMGLYRGNRPSLLDPALDSKDAWLAARPGQHHKHHLRPGGQLSTYMEPPLGDQGSSRSRPELLNLCRNEDPHICTGVFIDKKPCQFLNTPRKCAYWHWMPQEILDEIVTKRGVSHNFVQSLINNYEQRVPEDHQANQPKLRVPAGASAFAPKVSGSRASRPAPRPAHALSQQQGSGEDANQAEQDEEAVSPVPGSDDEDDIKAFSSDEE